MADLDSILSGESASAPEPARETAPSPQPETQSEQQPNAESDPSSHDDPQPDERGTVPIAALQAERQKAKRYTEQVAEFQQKLEQQNAQWEQRFRDLQGFMQQPRQAPQPAETPRDPIDLLLEKPLDFVQQNVAQALEPHLKQFTQALDANSRYVAIQAHTPEAVDAAVEAFNEGAASRSVSPEEYHAIRNAPNRYVAAVEWHKRTQALREIGNDPDGYRAKLEAEILAKHGLSPEAQPPAGTAAPAPVMPSNFAAARNVGNRSGPAWSGPASLDDIFATRK